MRSVLLLMLPVVMLMVEQFFVLRSKALVFGSLQRSHCGIRLCPREASSCSSG